MTPALAVARTQGARDALFGNAFDSANDMELGAVEEKLAINFGFVPGRRGQRCGIGGRNRSIHGKKTGSPKTGFIVARSIRRNQFESGVVALPDGEQAAAIVESLQPDATQHLYVDATRRIGYAALERGPAQQQSHRFHQRKHGNILNAMIVEMRMRRVSDVNPQVLDAMENRTADDH